MEQTKAALITVVAVIFWAAPALLLARLLPEWVAYKCGQSRPVPAVICFALAFCWPITLAFYCLVGLLSLCLMTLRLSSLCVPMTLGHQKDNSENWRRSLWAAVSNRHQSMMSKMRKSPEPHLADVERQVTADAAPKIQPNRPYAARGLSPSYNAQSAGSPRHSVEGLPTQDIDRQCQADIDLTVPPPGHLAVARETISRFATLDEQPPPPTYEALHNITEGRPPPPTYEARHNIAEDQRWHFITHR
ncbi:hypothetical protein BHE90_015863 [Fusarium euwallaceae]|uniref:Uncharacterized protein n=1 Tax=Fusarium euwallaceae TaxID=1147111 RepID=A0A430L1Z1_9HYPO|nr:hypothetical protein BHE90_015863 [Fusarium euwallaceae]